MPTLEPEKQESSFIVDIASRESYPINIGKQWCISTPSPKNKLVVVKRFVDKKVFLQSGKIEIDAALKVDVEKLFTVIYEGSEFYLSSQPYEINLSSPNTFFQLFLNPSAIKDCKEKQQLPPKKYQIHLPIIITNEKGKAIIEKKQAVNIQFAEVHTRPNVEVLLKEEFKTKKYPADSIRTFNEAIGCLRVTNPAKFDYFPELDGAVTFHVASEDQPDIALSAVSLDMEHPVKNSSAFEKANSNEFTFQKLKKGQQIELPILADFAELGNPYEFPNGRAYKISASIEYWHSNNESAKERSVPADAIMTILPDRQQIELGVFVKDWKTGEIQKIENNHYKEVSEVDFVPGDDMNYSSLVVLKNLAELGPEGSGIDFKEFRQKIVLYPEEGAAITFSNPRLNQQSVFGLNVEGAEFFLPTGAKKEYKFGFSPKQIKEIKSLGKDKDKYKLRVRLELSLKYGIRDSAWKKLEDDDYNTYNCAIDMPIYQRPYPEWLGIDFGTSAIVSVYESKGVLDLHKVKTDIFNNQADLYEKGTQFLSSNVILQYNALKNKEKSQLMHDMHDGVSALPNYNSLAICLSPTSSLEDKNARYLLPCLKLLMGYDLIPNLEKYGDFRYYMMDEVTNSIEEKPLFSKDSDNDLEYTELAYVDKVFEEVYSELFQFFIQKCIEQGNVRKLNNIILTYPNTYTVRHLEKLESIVSAGLKNKLDLRNIKFVSESDSVACYYQSHKSELNPNAPKNKESVLVYDMGAGTLDVTLFDVAKAASRTKITIKGKLGITKAGNYIDSVIAQVLSQTFSTLKIYAYQDNLNADRLETARYLKNYIKTVIKPALSDDENVKLSLEDASRIGIKKDEFNKHHPVDNAIELDLKVLIKDKQEYQELIKDCTERFFDNMFEFLDYSKYGSKPHIDTVILSGRSAKLKDVQDGLKKSISSWNEEDDRFVTVDLSQGVVDKSKTSVVEGAIDFAHLLDSDMSNTIISSRNVMAKFGVKYFDDDNKLCYQELLNPFKDKEKERVKQNGMEVFVYETTPVDLTLSDFNKKITLVQSYSANTEDDLRKGNTEYITEISEYKVSSSKAHLFIKVNKDNQLILNINGGESTGVTPSRIDITAQANKMSLWPMLN